MVSELSAGTTVEIEVIRGPGIFGRVTVEYEVRYLLLCKNMSLCMLRM